MKTTIQRYELKQEGDVNKLSSNQVIYEIMKARDVLNITIVNNGAIPVVKSNVSNNMLLGHIEPNIIISEIFINVTEAFDNAHLTIGDDDAQGRYVVQADVNLSRVGETMIFVNEHSVTARDVKIYFDKVNTVGKLDIIIYLG